MIERFIRWIEEIDERQPQAVVVLTWILTAAACFGLSCMISAFP